MQRKRPQPHVWLFVVGLALCLCSCAGPKCSQKPAPEIRPPAIRVACVGNSITYGYGLTNRDLQSYPARLSIVLGARWEVRNFGVSGATVLRDGIRPYSRQQAYRDALAFEPHVVIVELGTNDSKRETWQAHQQDFLADLLELIRSFQELKTRPHLYLCCPPPIFRDRGKPWDTDAIVKTEVIPKIREAAGQSNLEVIDLYAAFENSSELFPDGVHPDPEGANVLARSVRAAIVRKR